TQADLTVSFNEKYSTVLEVGNIVNMSLGLSEILQKSVDLIVKKLKYDSAVIFINEEENKIIRSRTFTNKAINNLLTQRLIGKSFDSLFVSYSESDNYIVRTVLEKKPYHSYDLKDFISPVISERIVKLLQTLSRTKSIIAIPIIYKDK